MTIALELPQTTDFLDPTIKLSSGFLKNFPIPFGLWCTSKLRNAAVDFNPLKKNFGVLNGGISFSPIDFGSLTSVWHSDGAASSYIDIGAINPGVVSGLTFAVFIKFDVQPNGFIPAGYNFGPSMPGLNFLGFSGPGGGFSGNNLQINTGGAAWNVGGVVKNLGPTYGTADVLGGGSFLNLHLFSVVANGTTNFVYIDGNLLTSYSCSTALGIFSQSSTSRFLTQSSAGYPKSVGFFGIWLSTLNADQNAALYSCLLTGKPFPLFEPDTLYIDGPQTSTTLNLTSKSFVFSSSNSQASIQRNINTQSDSLSDSQGNITFTRDLKSTLDSRSFSSSATSVLRPLDSKLISQSESSAAETRQILSSSIIISQSFSSGKFALSAFISLESTVCAESFSYVEINLSRVLNSTGFVLSDLLAEITVKRNLSSIGLSLSDSISQETILRPLASEVFSEAKDHAEISIEQLLTSEVLSSSLAKGQFTTQLYTKFELLSYRRYSSQYFVQSGSVNDSGQ